MIGKRLSETNPRRFGLAFAAGLATLGSILIWRQRQPGPYILVFAVCIAILAVVAPRVLVPLERILAKIFRWISAALTYSVLTLMYYLVMTPLAIVIRLLGQDLLEMKSDPGATSYWKDVGPSGPGSRSDRPF